MTDPTQRTLSLFLELPVPEDAPLQLQVVDPLEVAHGLAVRLPGPQALNLPTLTAED